MTIKSLEQGLRSRLWVLDIPLCYQREFTTLVVKWYHSSGVEWTIKRLKSLKVDLYRRRAGLPPLTWVRKNRGGDLAGCLGGLFRWADQSESNFRKVVQTLMCYSVFLYTKPTESQVKKFTSALSAPAPNIVGFDNLYKIISRKFGGQSVDRDGDVSLLHYRGSPSKRKPSVGLRSVPQDSNILRDVEALLENQWGRAITRQYKDLFDPVLEGLLPKPIHSILGETVSDPWQILGGKIAFIQEPGGKLRSVAMPFQVYQLALRHFGLAVLSLAKSLPWDCTHDQTVPIQPLMASLRAGKTVHSVDLSSATDYFPLEVQCNVMRALFGNIPDVSLFETIARSTWISPVGAVRWNRGQPLGLFPSFAVFTVTHGLLLWFLNGGHWKKDFYVLGDDVVITNDLLYDRYIRTLEAWGCPYSPDKSLSSNQICEFAGKVITSQSVTAQYKWREMSNDNFVAIARQLGHRSRILLSQRQRRIFDKIQHCVEPFGLNFSFPGSSRAEMEQITRSVFGPDKRRVLDSLVDQSEVVWKNLYGSPYTPSSSMLGPTVVDHSRVIQSLKTFDEKVRAVLRKALPWFDNQDVRLLSGVPGALGFTDLPPASILPSRLTELDRYEIMLNID